MSKNYTQISEEIDYLVKNVLSTKYLINPFFRISKTTPEETKIYNIIKSSHSFSYNFFRSAGILIGNLVKTGFYILMSFVMIYQYCFISRSRREIDYIFLTHAVGANIGPNPTDQYFALMPQFLNAQKYNVAMFYTNHNKFGYLKNYYKLKTKNTGIEIYLCPKFMLPHENIEFLFESFTLAINCLKIGIKTIKKEPYCSKILIAAVPYFFSRGAYNNYLLKKRCLGIQKRTKTKFFTFTFEGYSYEQYVFDALSESESECHGIFYQHSPIARGHIGLIHFMLGLQIRVQIMVTGSIYKKYLKNFLSPSEIIVVGSQKSKRSEFKALTQNKNTLLFAPEGTQEATLEFIDLIQELIYSNLPNTIVLRLHPNLRNSSKIYSQLQKLHNYKNFCVSKSELSTDLEEAAFVFFRSSAVGVEALLSGAHLVFYSKSNEPDLNPLSLMSNIYFEASNASDVLNLVKTKHKAINTQERSEAFDGFFSELNYSILLNLDKNA